MNYTLCKYCDHFVTDDLAYVDSDQNCAFQHIHDGEQEFDHNAEPSEVMSQEEWQVKRPELFVEYQDGRKGPNSQFYSRRGKIDGLANELPGERDTSLYNMRLGVCNNMFREYDFERPVKDVDEWENYPLNVFKCVFYFENGEGTFFVIFHPDSTQVIDTTWHPHE